MEKKILEKKILEKKIVSVLLSASVERFDVSRMRDFYFGARLFSTQWPPYGAHILQGLISNIYTHIWKEVVDVLQMYTLLGSLAYIFYFKFYRFQILSIL